MRKFIACLALGLAVLGFAGGATAQDAAASAPTVASAAASAVDAVAAVAASATASTPVANKGDNAWMLVSTLLVIMMTVPGLALFYGGLVRSKNILSVLMQVLVTFSLIVVLWALYGYSLAFTEGNAFVGGLDRLFMRGLFDPIKGEFAMAATFSKGVYIPELLFAAFQATFAGITCCLIVGAFAERIKFSAALLFAALWFTFSYAPIAHMVWFWMGPDAYASKGVVDAMNGKAGLLWQWGALDFAGGTVVHINAAVAIIIGFIAGFACLWGVHSLKRLLGADDTLDVFGVHGVGGIVGALLTGVFNNQALGGPGLVSDWVTVTVSSNGIWEQLIIQAKAVGLTVVWSAVVAAVAFKVVDLVIGLRVSEEDEREGLDISSHGETAYSK